MKKILIIMMLISTSLFSQTESYDCTMVSYYNYKTEVIQLVDEGYAKVNINEESFTVELNVEFNNFNYQYRFYIYEYSTSDNNKRYLAIGIFDDVIEIKIEKDRITINGMYDYENSQYIRLFDLMY